MLPYVEDGLHVNQRQVQNTLYMYVHHNFLHPLCRTRLSVMEV